MSGLLRCDWPLGLQCATFQMGMERPYMNYSLSADAWLIGVMAADKLLGS
ncbi:MAG: hypothetical protein GY892_09105 [Shimia sp.]|nr:hypothetical protein [Shimia sp.]